MLIVDKVENGPVLICPTVFGDARGYFYESFSDKWFRENVADTTFVQDNQSRSSYGVLRGMHFQKGEHAQAKLVRVVKGAVLDVVLDIRKESPNFGKFYPYYLSEDNHYQLFVPRGFAHGFVSLKDDTIFQYKCDNLYCKESEGAYRYDSFGFNWRMYIDDNGLNVSEKDKVAPPFSKDGTAEIPFDDIIALIVGNNDRTFEGLMKGIINSNDIVPINEDIYAVIERDGKMETVKLIFLTPYILDATDFASLSLGSRKIAVKSLSTGEEIILSKDLHEVKRFYRYE